MARRSMVELHDEAQTAFADNTTGAITPTILRSFVTDFVDTMAPAYGAIDITTPQVKALTTTNQILNNYTDIAATAGTFTTTPASGNVTQVLNGRPGCSTRFTFSCDVQGANNADVTFTIYINGNPTTFAVTTTITGATNFSAVSLTGLVYQTLDTVVSVFVRSSAAGNFTINNALLLCEYVPVNSYV